MIKNIRKRQVLFHLAEFQNVFLFYFGENVLFIFYVTCYIICLCRKTFKRSQKGFIEFLQSFLLRIFLVKVAISAVSYEFGHIYWRNPQWNPHILSSLTQMSWSPVVILFRNFMWGYNSLDVCEHNIDIFHFLVLLLCFLS